MEEEEKEEERRRLRLRKKRENKKKKRNARWVFFQEVILPNTIVTLRAFRASYADYFF